MAHAAASIVGHGVRSIEGGTECFRDSRRGRLGVDVGGAKLRSAQHRAAAFGERRKHDEEIGRCQMSKALAEFRKRRDIESSLKLGQRAKREAKAHLAVVDLQQHFAARAVVRFTHQSAAKLSAPADANVTANAASPSWSPE